MICIYIYNRSIYLHMHTYSHTYIIRIRIHIYARAGFQGVEMTGVRADQYVVSCIHFDFSSTNGFPFFLQVRRQPCFSSKVAGLRPRTTKAQLGTWPSNLPSFEGSLSGSRHGGILDNRCWVYGEPKIIVPICSYECV